MSNPLTEPGYLIPPLFGFIVALLLLVLVLKKGRRSDRSRIFAGVLVCLALWCLFTFKMRSSSDTVSAMPWEKALVIFAIAMQAFFYHFTLTYFRGKYARWVLTFAYTFLCLFSMLLATSDLVIKEMALKDFGYAPVSGPMAFPMYLVIPIMIVGGVCNLIRAYRKSTSYEERNRLIYLSLAVLFPVVGSGLDGFTDLPPMSIWANLIFCSICSVAILKYNLLDIRQIVRKSLAYLLVSAAIAIPYVSVLLFINHFLKTQSQPWWIHPFLVFPLALLLQPLYGWAQKIVDKLFYRDRYDYLRALEQFSHEAQSIIDLKQLSSAIVDLVVGALRTSSGCLLLAPEKHGGLRMVASSGIEEHPKEPVIRLRSILVKWLKKHQRIISLDEFEIVPQLQSLARRERKNLDSIKAELLVPIVSRRGQLSGILVLGPKSSALTYSREDRQLLATISSQMAMALENAGLYQEAVRTKENLESCLNSMTDSVIIVNSDLEIEFLNEAARERFSERTGEVCRGELAKINGYVRQAIDEYRSVKANGYPYIDRIAGRDYEIVSTPLLNPNAEISVINVLRDISARKQMERERKELEKKAQINSRLVSVGQMASGIAHEINNPLTAVIGYAQLLQGLEIPDEIREDLEKIMDGARRVSGIVNRLLAFARQQKPERKLINLNAIIVNTLELCDYNLKTANIEVATELYPELPETIADSGQLQQVFLNIIVNAEKAMRSHHGGRLSVATEQVDDFIRIAFSDSGSGIPREIIERIFDPFFTTRVAGEGTGLGLSVCHGIVSEHNGRIYARSEEGQGATFFIELPIVTKDLHAYIAESALQEDMEPSRDARILIVDDELMIRQILEKMLRQAGYRVDSVDNPFDALIRIKQNNYNLILLDLKMPGMSGIELYQHIEETAGSLKKRIVIITGDVMGKETEEFLSQSKVRFITKPFDMTQLRRDIGRILAGIR